MFGQWRLRRRIRRDARRARRNAMYQANREAENLSMWLEGVRASDFRFPEEPLPR